MTGQKLLAILWLRYRLTRNQWTKGKGFGAVFAAVVGAGALAVSAGSFALGAMAGYVAIGAGHQKAVPLIWLALTIAFLFAWAVGSLVELQRSEVVDIPRLLHFPIGLGQVFLVNYLTSHASVTVVLFVPAMFGLAVGAAMGRGAGALVMVPASLAAVICITAWTYCVQGRLAALVTNPRRKRIVLVCVSMFIILLGQLPNILIHLVPARSLRTFAMEVEAAAQARSAWMTTACLTVLAALGLLVAYRDTLRFYRGVEKYGARWQTPASGTRGPPIGTAGRQAEAAAAVYPRRPRLVERSVPGLPEPAAAVATATLRSLLRAPEVAMSVGLSLVLSCLVGGTMLLRFRAEIGASRGPLMVEGAMGFSAFILLPFLSNQFGYDRDGFRTLVLSPVDRKWILLGKNVAGMTLGAAACLPVLATYAVALRAGALVIGAALLQMAALLLAAVTVGNVLSIFLPFRVAAGSLRASGAPTSTWLAVVACQLASPVFFAPAFVPTLVASALASALRPLADLVLSLGIAVLSVGVYAFSLGRLGPKLKRREDVVLQRVTTQQE